jgi:glycosyltransferase involved in cell wall biosynthesis
MSQIIFIITRSTVGGAQLWVLNEIRQLIGRCSIVLVTSDRGWLTDEVAKLNVTLIIEPRLRSYFSVKCLWNLRKILKKHNGLVVASSANAGFYSRLAGLFTRNPVVYVSHGWSASYRGNFFTRWIFSTIEYSLVYITYKIICISSRDYKFAMNNLKISKDKLLLFRNKIPGPMKSPRGEFRANQIRLLMVARFEQPKRHDIAIEAFGSMSGVSLTFVGGGSNFISQKFYAEPHDNILFLGEISNFDMYNDFDIFVLLSDSEGLPISGIEAIRSGMPLLLSNVGGCGELISGNGELVSNNIEEIRAALLRIVKNYREYSYRSHQLFREMYCSDAKSTELLSLIGGFNDA